MGPLSLGGPFSLRALAGVGERELAEETGLARSAYMSSESALRTELLLDEAEETEDTLLTVRDLWEGANMRGENRKSQMDASHFCSSNRTGQN